MRIVICAAFYPPYRGGYAESVRLLAEGLYARGNAVTVVACATGASREETVCGVSVWRVPAWNPSWLHGSFPVPHLFRFWSVLSATRKKGIDIISTQTRFFPSTFIGFVFGKLYGIPVIHTERGAMHTESGSFLVRICAKIADYTAGRLICRFSNGVIGVSDAACVFVRRLGARNPVVVYNGIDVAWWRRPDGLGQKGGTFRITFVGRLVYAKGVRDLLTAVSVLLPEFPSLRVSIVGDGPYRSTLEALTKKIAHADAMRFHGALDPAGVRSILWRSDMLVNPSYSEGFPRSVLEAAAAGLPILATDVGGTRELIQDGVNGIIVRAKSVAELITAIRRVMGDPALRARIGATAAARSCRFSIESMAEAYEKNFTTHAVL